MNRQSLITILLTMLMSMTGAKVFAHDIEAINADGKSIYYVWTNNKTELAVSYRGDSYGGDNYFGEIVIPESVNYDGKTYSVTAIVNSAFYGCSGLTSVTIPNSVTSIGDYAFRGCTNLQTATISNGVTSIGENAFFECTNLQTATIPNSVTSIGKWAFFKCTNLQTATIPNGVTSIGDCTFYNCIKLTSVTIPNSVTSIGTSAFEGCSRLATITATNSVTSIGEYAFSGTEWYNSLPDGLVYVGKVLYRYKGEMPANTSINIADGTIELAVGAFSGCKGLTTITIPNSVTSIGGSAFKDCSGLTSITIPNSVTSIGDYAFSNTSLISVTIPNGVTSIGRYAFYCCYGLATLSIPKSLTSIGDNAFSWCAALTTIKSDIENLYEINTDIFYVSRYTKATLIVPAGKKGAYLSISGWSSFQDIVETGEGGITGKEIEVEGIYYIIGENNTVSLISTYPKNSTNQKSPSNIEIPKQVTYNGKNYSVTSIGESAFRSNLIAVTIPNSVTYIDNNAFNNCNNLKTAEIHCTTIGSWFSGSNSLQEVIIGDETTTIAKSAFNNCSNLSELTIPSSVISVGIDAFSGTAWFNNQPDGVIYIGKAAYKYKGQMPANTSISLKEGTSEIVSEAFYGCSGLTSVTIPNSVTSINGNTFYNCTSLTSVTIPNSVTSIGHYAFAHCGLISVTIPNSVTSIDIHAFESCPSLKTVTIGNGVTFIGNSAFINCDRLATIVLERETPFEIDNYQNSIAKNTVTFIVPVGTKAAYQSTEGWSWFPYIVEVGEGGVKGCRFIVDGNHYTIGENNTAAITSVSGSISGAFAIPNQVEFNGKKYDVTSIGSSAFSGCYGLTSVTIPNSVTSIGNGAFYSCSGLTSVTIPNSVTSIDNYAFQNCSGLTSITIPNSVTSIGNYAFQWSGLTSVTIPNSVTSIERYTFEGCRALTSVTFGNSVTSIGEYAFQNCSGLTSVTIPSSVTSIDSYAFYSCSSLTSVTIGNGVTSIGNSAFSDCDALTSVTIPNSVKSIGDNAFWDCKILSSVTIPSSVISIGKYVFGNCINLITIVSEIKKPFKIKEFIVSSPITLIVPAGTKAAYQSTEGWSKIRRIVEVGEGGVDGSTFEVGGIYYTIDENNNAAISSMNEAISGAFEIPSQVEFNGKTYDVSIGDDAFSGCTGLTSVTIPNSVESIGDNAFSGCTGLTSVTIPNSVESIGDDAFSGCTALTTVTIPNSVESIGDDAFYGCSGLTSVTIPNSVNSIGDNAFSGCSSLKYITFGSNLESIGQEAFSDCTALVEITSKAQTPPVCGPQALEDINKGECKLYVPDGSLAAYEKADQWKDFLSKEEGEGTQPQEPVVGDVNSDGKMDKNDLRDLVEYIMGNKPNGVTFESADVNGDNKVNVADVVALTTLLK